MKAFKLFSFFLDSDIWPNFFVKLLAIQFDVSINFNIGNTSSILRESNFEEWLSLYNKVKSLEVKRILNYRIPLSVFSFSKHYLL